MVVAAIAMSNVDAVGLDPQWNLNFKSIGMS